MPFITITENQGWKGFYDFLGLEPPVKPLQFKEEDCKNC